MPRDDDPEVEAHAPLPHCVECSRVWAEVRERWETHLLDGEALFYCPACAAREFGDGTV